MKERGRRVRAGEGDATAEAEVRLLSLKLEGDLQPRNTGVSLSWRRQGADSPLELPEGA